MKINEVKRDKTLSFYDSVFLTISNYSMMVAVMLNFCQFCHFYMLFPCDLSIHTNKHKSKSVDLPQVNVFINLTSRNVFSFAISKDIILVHNNGMSHAEIISVILI